MSVRSPSLKGRSRKIILAGSLLGAFWIWYLVAADYGYQAVSGTYVLDRRPERSTLILHRNQVFEQEVGNAGTNQRTRGTWRRIGESGVVFSNDFLTVNGQQRTDGGNVYGEVEKGFAGLFVSAIAFKPEHEGAVFRKYRTQ